MSMTAASLDERLVTSEGTTADARQIPRVPPSNEQLNSTTGSGLQLDRTSTLANERERTYRQTIKHHWECTVISLGCESFVATMRSLRDPDETEKEAEIPLEEINPDDLELLELGAVFYWTIGYEISPAGTRRRFSLIKFRRMPAWSKKDVQRVRADAAELYEMFGDRNARDTTRSE